MQSPFANLRLANDILNRAEERDIEEVFLVVEGDRWVNGQSDDDVSDKFPAFSEMMTDLEYEYGREALLRAFELLIEQDHSLAL